MPLTEEEVDQVKQLIHEAVVNPPKGGPFDGFIDGIILGKLKGLIESVTAPEKWTASVQNTFPELSPEACRGLGLLVSDKLRGVLYPPLSAQASSGAVLTRPLTRQ